MDGAAGMVAVVRGLKDAGLAVTLYDNGKEFTLAPNTFKPTSSTSKPSSVPLVHMHQGLTPQQMPQKVQNVQHGMRDASHLLNTQAPTPRLRSTSTDVALDRLDVSCNSGAQAVDGRYASVYQTTVGKIKPTSPPVLLTEFPPQRPVPDLRGHGNFVVGGTGSGDTTYTPVRAPNSFRGGLSWCDRDGKTSSRFQQSQTRNSEHAEVEERRTRSPSKLVTRGIDTFCQRFSEESPTRERPGRLDSESQCKKTAYSRNYDVRFLRDFTRSRRSSPTGSPPSVVNSEIQAAAVMVCRESVTASKTQPTRQHVAVPSTCIPDSKSARSKPTKCIQTAPFPDPLQTTLSCIDISSNDFIPTIRRSRSDEQMSSANLHKESLQKLEGMFRNQVLHSNAQKVTVNKILPQIVNKQNKGGPAWHKDCDDKHRSFRRKISKDFVNKMTYFKNRNVNVYRAEVSSFICFNDEVRKVVSSWLESFPLKTHDFLGRPVRKEHMISYVICRLKIIPPRIKLNKKRFRSEIQDIVDDIPFDTGQVNKKIYSKKLVEDLVTKLENTKITNLSKRYQKRYHNDAFIVNTAVDTQKYINLTDKTLAELVRHEFQEGIRESRLDLDESHVYEVEDELINILRVYYKNSHKIKEDEIVNKIVVLLRGTGQLMKNQATSFAYVLVDKIKKAINTASINENNNIGMVHNVNSRNNIVDNYKNTSNATCTLNLIDQVCGTETRNNECDVINIKQNFNNYTYDTTNEYSNKMFKTNIESYKIKLHKVIFKWLDAIMFDIPQVRNPVYRKIIVNDLISDIIDRYKYLEVNKSVKISDEDETEYLRYQIFKWMNKLAGRSNLATLDKAADLMKKIRSVSIPTITNRGMRRLEVNKNTSPIHCSIEQHNKHYDTQSKRTNDATVNVGLTKIEKYNNSRAGNSLPGSQIGTATGSVIDRFSDPAWNVNDLPDSVLTYTSTQNNPNDPFVMTIQESIGRSADPELNQPSAVHETPALTIERLNKEYEEFVKTWVHLIPLPPEISSDLAEKIRLGLFHGVFKAVAKIKSSPAIMVNPLYYEDVMDDEIEEMFRCIPDTEEFKSKKHLLKVRLIEKTSEFNEMIKIAYAPDTFGQKLVEQVSCYVPRVECKDDESSLKVFEDLKIHFFTEDYILYIRYRNEDQVKANIYRMKLMRRVQEFVRDLKKTYNKELRDVNSDMYINDILAALHQVPLPSSETIKQEADEILLGMEIDAWFNDLPLVTNDDVIEQLKRRRLRDRLAKKIYDMEKCIDFADESGERALKHEVSLTIDKLPLQRDQSGNINFMVDELANRIKNRQKQFMEETSRKSLVQNMPHLYLPDQQQIQQVPIQQFPGQIDVPFNNDSVPQNASVRSGDRISWVSIPPPINMPAPTSIIKDPSGRTWYCFDKKRPKSAPQSLNAFQNIYGTSEVPDNSHKLNLSGVAHVGGPRLSMTTGVQAPQGLSGPLRPGTTSNFQPKTQGTTPWNAMQGQQHAVPQAIIPDHQSTPGAMLPSQVMPSELAVGQINPEVPTTEQTFQISGYLRDYENRVPPLPPTPQHIRDANTSLYKPENLMIQDPSLFGAEHPVSSTLNQSYQPMQEFSAGSPVQQYIGGQNVNQSQPDHPDSPSGPWPSMISASTPISSKQKAEEPPEFLSLDQTFAPNFMFTDQSASVPGTQQNNRSNNVSSPQQSIAATPRKSTSTYDSPSPRKSILAAQNQSKSPSQTSQGIDTKRASLQNTRAGTRISFAPQTVTGPSMSGLLQNIPTESSRLSTSQRGSVPHDSEFMSMNETKAPPQLWESNNFSQQPAQNIAQGGSSINNVPNTAQHPTNEAQATLWLSKYMEEHDAAPDVALYSQQHGMNEIAKPDQRSSQFHQIPHQNVGPQRMSQQGITGAPQRQSIVGVPQRQHSIVPQGESPQKQSIIGAPQYSIVPQGEFPKRQSIVDTPQYRIVPQGESPQRQSIIGAPRHSIVPQGESPQRQSIVDTPQYRIVPQGESPQRQSIVGAPRQSISLRTPQQDITQPSSEFVSMNETKAPAGLWNSDYMPPPSQLVGSPRHSIVPQGELPQRSSQSNQILHQNVGPQRMSQQGITGAPQRQSIVGVPQGQYSIVSQGESPQRQSIVGAPQHSIVPQGESPQRQSILGAPLQSISLRTPQQDITQPSSEFVSMNETKAPAGLWDSDYMPPPSQLVKGPQNIPSNYSSSTPPPSDPNATLWLSKYLKEHDAAHGPLISPNDTLPPPEYAVFEKGHPISSSFTENSGNKIGPVVPNGQIPSYQHGRRPSAVQGVHNESLAPQGQIGQGILPQDASRASGVIAQNIFGSDVRPQNGLGSGVLPQNQAGQYRTSHDTLNVGNKPPLDGTLSTPPDYCTSPRGQFTPSMPQDMSQGMTPQSYGTIQQSITPQGASGLGAMPTGSVSYIVPNNVSEGMQSPLEVLQPNISQNTPQNLSEADRLQFGSLASGQGFDQPGRLNYSGGQVSPGLQSTPRQSRAYAFAEDPNVQRSSLNKSRIPSISPVLSGTAGQYSPELNQPRASTARISVNTQQPPRFYKSTNQEGIQVFIDKNKAEKSVGTGTGGIGEPIGSSTPDDNVRVNGQPRFATRSLGSQDSRRQIDTESGEDSDKHCRCYEKFKTLLKNKPPQDAVRENRSNYFQDVTNNETTSKKFAEKNTFLSNHLNEIKEPVKNIKCVQTTLSDINVKMKRKHNIRKTKSHEHITEHEQNLNDDVTDWLRKMYSAHKTKRWTNKLLKLAEKLSIPGEEEKLKVKIKQFLERVPSNFSDGDLEGQKFRKRLPDYIVKKIKKMSENKYKPYKVYTVSLPEFRKADKESNLSQIIKMWIKNVPVKKRDFLGRLICKADIITSVVQRLKPFLLNRPKTTKDFMCMLRSYIIEIVSEMPLDCDLSEIKDYINLIAEDLVDKITGLDKGPSIENVTITHFVSEKQRLGSQAVVKKLEDFVEEQILFYLDHSGLYINNNKMSCIQVEVAGILVESLHAPDVYKKSEMKSDIFEVLTTVGKIPVSHAKHLSAVLVNNFKEIIGNRIHVNELIKKQSQTYLVNEFSEEKMRSTISSKHLNRNIKIYTEKVANQVELWLNMFKDYMPMAHHHYFREMAINELTEAIVSKHKSSRQHLLTIEELSADREYLKVLIYKWIRNLAGEDKIELIQGVPELISRINKIPVPELTSYNESWTSILPSTETRYSLNANIVKELENEILDWYYNLPSYLRHTNDRKVKNKHIPKLAIHMERNRKFNKCTDDILDNEVDCWAKRVLNYMPQSWLLEELKTRIRNTICQHDKNYAGKQITANTRTLGTKTDFDKINFISKICKRHPDDTIVANKKVLINEIDKWLSELPVSINDMSLKHTAVNNLASDIIDRQRYLELNPNLKRNETVELENLKYQIFKWIKICEDNMETVAYAPQLMARLQKIRNNKVPVTLCTDDTEKCGRYEYVSKKNSSLKSFRDNIMPINPKIKSATTSITDFTLKPTFVSRGTGSNDRGFSGRHGRITYFSFVDLPSTRPTQSNPFSKDELPDSYCKYFTNDNFCDDVSLNRPCEKYQNRKENVVKALKKYRNNLNHSSYFTFPDVDPNQEAFDNHCDKMFINCDHTEVFTLSLPSKNKKFDISKNRKSGTFISGNEKETDIPLGMSLSETYEYFDQVFEERCDEIPVDEIPVDESTPEMETFGELHKQQIHNDLWKTFFRLKSDPSIENDYTLFEAMLDDKLDLILEFLPRSKETDHFKREWKTKVILDATRLLEYIHSTTNSMSFKHILLEKLDRHFVKPYTKGTLVKSRVYALETVNEFILYSRYRSIDSIRAYIYKQRLMMRLNELANHVKTSLNIETKNPFTINQLCHEAYKILNSVPLPDKDKLRYTAKEILMNQEIDEWYNELTLEPSGSSLENLLINRMKEILARKLNDIEDKYSYMDDDAINKDMFEHVKQFLQKEGVLLLEQHKDINFLAKELVNRLANRRQRSVSNLQAQLDTSVLSDPFYAVPLIPLMASEPLLPHNDKKYLGQSNIQGDQAIQYALLENNQRYSNKDNNSMKIDTTINLATFTNIKHNERSKEQSKTTDVNLTRENYFEDLEVLQVNIKLDDNDENPNEGIESTIPRKSPKPTLRSTLNILTNKTNCNGSDLVRKYYASSRDGGTSTSFYEINN